MASAALVAAVIAPAAASALLTNEYNQSFAGTAVCIDCHGAAYDATSHGQFARTGEAMNPAASSDMWPVGLSGKGATVASNEMFALGAGTGLYEYIKFGAGTPANGPFGVLTAEWDPRFPNLWEIDGEVGVEFEDYACNQCHQLGAVKKGVRPPISGATTGTLNTWAIPAGADPLLFSSYIPGSSIQCERCHGTGVAASLSADGHWSSGVKIVGFNTPAMKSTAKAASQKILKSEVCGQCHGSFKSGGNPAGFTPDATLSAFLPNQYTLADVPDQAAFEASAGLRASAKFFPNGENKNLKHVYYTEWALSGHSVRGFYSATATGFVTPYQATGASHFASTGATRTLCNRCHTGEGYLKRKGATIMSGWTENPADSGKIGQECAACHISHGDVGADGTTAKGEAVGMAVRAPETAMGNYSTFGLSVDNKSICEDCHNWQKEITNPGETVPLPSILGKYVSHPQREVYHGRAMLEIPAGEDFMPGAKCEQCHMPATKTDFPDKTGIERYADRSWKRYSHRMFIMEPGDAEAWGLAPWGDSCSPCHTGENQGALQANIDKWQTTASALADEASSAIAAGKLLFAVAPSTVVTDGMIPAGDLDLLKRGSANLSLFVQDSSEGAHNPTYEQAGLTKAAELAKSAGGEFDHFFAPSTVGNGAYFAIAGTLENGDDTHPAGATVTLFDGATQMGMTTSDANGNFSFTLAQSTDKVYTVKWERSSNAASDLTMVADVDVAGPPVGDKTATTVTLTRSASTIVHGHSVTFSGTLAPVDAAPATIRISYKKPGSSKWVIWRYVEAPADGTFITRWSTGSRTTRGTWSWKAYYGATTDFLGDNSPVVTVRVK